MSGPNSEIESLKKEIQHLRAEAEREREAHKGNITAQISAENELRKAKLEAENANLAKTAFIANMSHEIRTPIGVIIGFCELLLGEAISSEERTNYLERVVKNAKGLTRIIDDILDIAKVEAGKLEVEEVEFSFGHLLTEVVELFSDRAQEKAIYLKLYRDETLPRYIWTDPTRLRQILINIVGNAVKFTTRGGIEIRATGKAIGDDRYEFEVKVIDSGIGLSQSMQQLVFQPFVQANSRTNRIFGGTGLGLVISRRLAVALGGNIVIGESREGKGSTFVITFQAGVKDQTSIRASNIKSPSTLGSDTPSSQFVKLKGIHILLAEDSPDNQLLIKRILIKHGATVVVANDGEEAIAKASSEQFDIVLMDVQMPRVDGYEATRSLRQNGFVKPIVALTAHAMIEEKKRSKDAGCTAHLTKPINALELVDAIVGFTR